ERVGSSFKGRVTYHDSCHLLRGLGESAAPRKLLRAVGGVELVELPGADECCGFGGSFSVRLPEVSSAILDKKLANAERTGADCLVACDAGCLMQMGGGLTRRGSRVKALHLAQVLAGEDSRSEAAPR
ncbi:MAG TPA: (Fe-S)-binding protein, partial [Methylomirabilota bacterium]|nr:(Fe-S)-binding protein [Methylomirabilota bacterium]